MSVFLSYVSWMCKVLVDGLVKASSRAWKAALQSCACGALIFAGWQEPCTHLLLVGVDSRPSGSHSSCVHAL